MFIGIGSGFNEITVIGWCISLELSIESSWFLKTLLKASQVGALTSKSRILMIKKPPLALWIKPGFNML